MLKLEFVDKSQASFWVVDDEFGIGSSNKNQLVINKKNVAPFHARIFQEGGKLFIKPASAGAAVRVNHKPIQEAATISTDSIISLGDIDLKLIDPAIRQKMGMTTQMVRVAEPLKQTDKSDSYEAKEVIWKVASVSDTQEGDAELIDVIGIVKVGRDPSNDIVVNSSHISRRHAEFFVRNEQLLVRDLNSSNGTYVNDERIQERSIFLGDEIAFDSHIFRVMTGKAPTVRDELGVDKTQFRPALSLDDLRDDLPEEPDLDLDSLTHDHVTNDYATQPYVKEVTSHLYDDGQAQNIDSAINHDIEENYDNLADSYAENFADDDYDSPRAGNITKGFIDNKTNVYLIGFIVVLFFMVLSVWFLFS